MYGLSLADDPAASNLTEQLLTKILHSSRILSLLSLSDRRQARWQYRASVGSFMLPPKYAYHGGAVAQPVSANTAYCMRGLVMSWTDLWAF